MEKTKGRGTVAEIATETPSTTDETDMKLFLTQFDTYSAVMQQVAYLADFEHKLCDLSNLLHRVLDEPYGMSRYLSTRHKAELEAGANELNRLLWCLDWEVLEKEVKQWRSDMEIQTEAFTVYRGTPTRTHVPSIDQLELPLFQPPMPDRATPKKRKSSSARAGRSSRSAR